MRPAVRPSLETKVADPSRIDQSSDSHFSYPHAVELEVRRTLLSQMNCHFHSLVVLRTQDGICLQGVASGEPTDAEEICRIAAKVSGVGKVINRLIFQSDGAPEVPAKG